MDEEPTLQGEFRKAGYSREDEWFYEINRELIERKRQELDAARRATLSENQEKAHWMRCPKCGGEMKSIGLSRIQLEQCSHCFGVYVDRGELETLLEAREAKTFLKRLRQIFEMPQDLPKTE